jgi:hypothetical protein
MNEKNVQSTLQETVEIIQNKFCRQGDLRFPVPARSLRDFPRVV